jgi:uncharacterized SAM-binding protein YcdF (DUF218 family)
MRCARCILMFLGTLCMFGVAVTGLFFWFAADWLAPVAAAQHADAIVVLAGAPERVLYAADLYREGYAPRVLLSRPAPDVREPLYARFGIKLPREEETSMHILTVSGVPADRVELFGAGSKSTVEEIETLRARYVAQPLRLLFVTSPLHVRRAGMIARDVLGGTKIIFAIVATPYERVPRHWWTDQDTARNVVLEVTKTLFYRLGGRYRTAAADDPGVRAGSR